MNYSKFHQTAKYYLLLLMMYCGQIQAQCVINYDNIVRGDDQTIAKLTNGDYVIWGRSASNNQTDLLEPTVINATNFPGLTGTILHATIGSVGTNQSQYLVLTTTGLFGWGGPNFVFKSALSNYQFPPTIKALTVEGQTNGLPVGVQPTDVKMLFATGGNLAITTTNGHVYVLAMNTYEPRGAGRTSNATGDDEKWWQVMENATTPLTNVVATRGQTDQLMALKADGTVWTWGRNTYLGDGSDPAGRNYATQMTLPTGLVPKMIGMTYGSYYILGADGKLYTLGSNTSRQLGDFTNINRLSWVNVLNAAGGAPVSNIVYFNPQEHSHSYQCVNYITQDGKLYGIGSNEFNRMGLDPSPLSPPLSIDSRDPAIPQGISPTDFITNVATGNRSSIAFKRGSNKHGFVGIRHDASIGNGQTFSGYPYIGAYDFDNPPALDVQLTISSGPSVAGTPTVTQATCNAAGTAANNDAKIDITGITNGTSYAYTTDGTAPAFAGAATLTGTAINLTGLANPAVSTTYTFRIFNGTADCYVETTAILNPKTCTPACTPRWTTVSIRVN